MFDRIIAFFAHNSRINYFLFVLTFLVGIWAYQKTPKEIFPSFALDMISINGAYAGSSIDMLDKMAVSKIEDAVKGIDGIKSMTTVINPGRFNIILELEKRVDKYATSDLVKDAIARSSQNLPSDMNTPTVNVLEIEKELLSIAVASKTLNHEALLDRAKKLKDEIMTIPNISGVNIYGDSDRYWDIVIDSKKIAALGLNTDAVIQAISKLSYIYPIGKLEDRKKGFYYLSTYNGPKKVEQMLQSRLHIQNKVLTLKDIAQAKKRYIDASTLFMLQDKDAIDLSIKQSPKGNAITLAKKLAVLVQKVQKEDPEAIYKIHNDRSVIIKDRLNIIISNILFGILLITLLMTLLINFRLAFIIAIGIPTAFVMGVYILYVMGYSINMISLVGVLIALGIIVDDAIVVSENIQQYIEKGYPAKEAAILGAKEMAKPVTIASLTTVFALLPMLMMSGVMGLVIRLIPITITVLILTSLIEAFIFLPIHASHTLSPNAKVRSWSRANAMYSKLIHLAIRYKKSFLTIFVIIVPLLTLLALKSSKFQMFPNFDASTLTLTLKLSPNHDVKDTQKVLETIEQKLNAKKDDFSIKLIGSVAGYRRNSLGVVERYPYVGMMVIELHKLNPQNFVDRFITPYLSFYYDKSDRIRTQKSHQIAQKLRAFIQKEHFKEQFHLHEIDIGEVKAGDGKSDLKIGLQSNNEQKVIQAITKIESKLHTLKGVTSVSDSINFGIDEIKLKPNAYGESLGITERDLGQLLAGSYLENRLSLAFDTHELLEIRVHDKYKDSLQDLKDFRITTPSGDRVTLSSVCDFVVRKNFEKVIKDFGVKNFYIYANVDGKQITASEALQKLQPQLDAVRKSGIKINLKGESEKRKDLRSDMIAASALAMMLITLSLLYLFNSFRESMMLLSVIPFSILGVLIGHMLLGLNLSMPSIIGILGLSGIVINDGIIMIMTLKAAKSQEEIYQLAAKRLRPIVLTSITTLIGLMTLIFFPTGQAAIFQPMAVALGFGLAWGTILNLLYLPALYAVINAKKIRKKL